MQDIVAPSMLEGAHEVILAGRRAHRHNVHLNRVPNYGRDRGCELRPVPRVIAAEMHEFKISVDKDYLVFAAGHFITYDGVCETLHGHNYRVRVEVEGELDENQIILDFGTLKTIMRRLVDELDHKMLLPLDNPRIIVRQQDDEIHVSYGKRRYVFPKDDVVLLPVANTTAELLARYLAQRLIEHLGITESTNLSSIVVEVEESFGQSAWYRERLDAAPRSADRAPAG